MRTLTLVAFTVAAFFLCAGRAPAQCIDAEEFCRLYGDSSCGRAQVAPDTSLPQWAGEIDQFCPNPNTPAEETVVVVLVEWTTDVSEYKCGQLVKKRIGELKDFAYRSIRDLDRNILDRNITAKSTPDFGSYGPKDKQDGRFFSFQVP